ncbi:hypothetical protein [Gordonia sp. NPDC127522]|uniref:hypothetical protein n=1 Tax=Gordonia sp. NPDC127522 TaxID=3345390 RepID=UPI0036366E04
MTGQVKDAVDASAGQVNGQLLIDQQVAEVVGTYLPVFTPSGGGFGQPPLRFSLFSWC